jgi:hypothetical protein
VSEAARNERNALIRRVDELAQRQQQTHEEVPLLTEIVEGLAPAQAGIPAEELEAIAKKLEAMVLAEVVPAVDRIIEAAHADLKNEIATSIHRAVREALAPLAKP